MTGDRRKKHVDVDKIAGRRNKQLERRRKRTQDKNSTKVLLRQQEVPDILSS